MNFNSRDVQVKRFFWHTTCKENCKLLVGCIRLSWSIFAKEWWTLMKISASCSKWSRGFFSRFEKRAWQQFFRNKWNSLEMWGWEWGVTWKIGSTSSNTFMWFWLTVLHYQLPLYAARMGTYLERSVPQWARQYKEGCRKPERSSLQEQVGGFSLWGFGSLFVNTSVTHYVVMLKFPHLQNQTMIFTCFKSHALEHWED